MQATAACLVACLLPVFASEPLAEITRLLDAGQPAAARERLAQALRDKSDVSRLQALETIATHLDAELPDPTDLRLPDPLAARFRQARGPHLLLLHQVDQESVARRLAHAERVYATFLLRMASMGLDLELPRERLVLVVFARRSDYQAFLRADGAIGFLDTQGYYHPTRQVVVLFDERSTAITRRDTARLATRTRLASGDPADLEAERQRIARRRVEVEDGTTAHELVHLLVHETDLARRVDDWPLWLHEGLAMQFEVMAGANWAGIAAPNPQRLADLRKYADRASPDLAGVLARVPAHRGYDPVFYARSWHLVHRLWQEQPETLSTLIAALQESQRTADTSEVSITRRRVARIQREVLLPRLGAIDLSATAPPTDTPAGHP